MQRLCGLTAKHREIQWSSKLFDHEFIHAYYPTVDAFFFSLCYCSVAVFGEDNREQGNFLIRSQGKNVSEKISQFLGFKIHEALPRSRSKIKKLGDKFTWNFLGFLVKIN